MYMRCVGLQLPVTEADIEKWENQHQLLQCHLAGSRSFGAKTRVHLPSVMRNLQALDRLVRTIGELCARRLDRISRLNVRRQGDRGLGQHSATVGKYIDVSILLLSKLGVARGVRRWFVGKAACCATIREGVELVTVSLLCFSLFSSTFGRTSIRLNKRRTWQ